MFKSLDKKNDGEHCPQGQQLPGSPGPLRQAGPSFTAFVVPGRIDAQEIMQSLRDLGVKISEQQAEKILKR